MVTILFSDLTDSTGIAVGLEPEQFADLLEQIRQVAHRVIPAHGGEIIRVDGDGMLCLFGYPLPFEDAARRATEAALDMHAAMTALELAFASPGRPLRLHTGIHAGLVLLRGGDMVRGKYEILGDATNVAARLCDAASPGEILVSLESLGQDHHFFLTGATRTLALRGRSTALQAWPVTGRAATARRFETRQRAGLTPLQGRSDERAAFLDWLSGRGDTCPVFFIHGPAGIGKSRLLHQFGEAGVQHGWTVLNGYCESYLSARPLQPFWQMAESLGDDGVASPPDPVAILREQIIASENVLLLIDDWQWADDASRDMLLDLVAQAGTEFKCVLASREAEAPELADLPVVSLAVPPLDRNATLGVIEQLLLSPDPFAVDRIGRASGGSPLLIEELCHALADGRAAPQLDPRGAWFDQAVQARFDKLDTHDRYLLMLAAVVGQIVPLWLLEHMLAAPIQPSQLERLQAADFLFPTEAGYAVRFKHGLTRDALYAAVGLAERRALHAAAFSALEAARADRELDSLLDSLAYHALASGQAEKGLPYAIAAGDAALAIGALDKAQAHFLAGLDIVPALTGAQEKRDVARLLLNKFGLACIVDPSPDQLPVLERAAALLEVTGHPRDVMRGAYWLGSIAYGIGAGKLSVRHLDRALQLAETAGTANDRLLVTTKRAHSLFASGRLAEAIEQFEAVLPSLATATGRNERQLSAYAHAGYAFLNAERGDFARAARLFRSAEDVLDDPADAMNASLLLYQSASFVSQGDWTAALDAAEAVRAVSQRSRARMQNRTCRAQAAYAHWQLSGDACDAEALELLARQFLVPGNSMQHVSMVFGWVVDAMVDLDAPDRARFYMGQIVRRVREAGDRLGEAMGWRAMARAAQARNDSARADRYLAFAEHSAAIRLSAREAAHNRLCRAQLLLTRGRIEEAADVAKEAAGAFDTMAMPAFSTMARALTSR